MLNFIKCQDSRRHYHHDYFVTEDMPSRVDEEGLTSTHLSGQHPVYDLDVYLKKNRNIPFLVIREHECAKILVSASDFDNHGKKRQQTHVLPESISIVSNSLRDALVRVAACGIDEVFWHTSFPRPEMTAPYLFLYHHRQTLLQYASAAEKTDESLTGTHIKALYRYLDETHGQDIQEVDRLLKREKLTRKHFQKLFRPHDAIVVQRDNVLLGYVPTDWPVRTKSGLSISCWCWTFQGQWLQRKEEKLEVSISGPGEINIQDLKAYPLRYAPLPIQEQLALRGRKYWDMRYQSFISYNGDSFEGDQSYVSQSTHPNLSCKRPLANSQARQTLDS